MILRIKICSAEMTIIDDAFSVCVYKRLATIFEITTPHWCRRGGIFAVFSSGKLNMGTHKKTFLVSASCGLMLFVVTSFRA